MTSEIRVVLVDDQALVRTGLAMVVDAVDDMRVVGEAADGSQALDVVATTPCDIVLMDVRMPTMDGVAATRELVRRHPSGLPRVVVLTTFDLDEYAFAALRVGASGFLLKDAPAEDVIAAIRSVHAGDAVIAASTTRRLLDHVAAALPGGGDDHGLDVLTQRELAVMVEIAQGATNSEIAASLYLAEATVKTHVGRILSKLGLRDRVQIVIRAYEAGLVGRGGTRPRSAP
jgi:DNA-binding NarL/FixJ family response regulator